MALVWRRLCSAQDAQGNIAYVEGRHEDTPGDPAENVITRVAWANPTTNPVVVHYANSGGNVLARTIPPGTPRQEANVPPGRQRSWEDEDFSVNCG